MKNVFLKGKNKKIGFSLFKKCDFCKKPRILNLFQEKLWSFPDNTCKICKQNQFNQAMDAMNDYYAKESEKQAKNEKEVFYILKQTLCEDFITDIHDCINDCEGGYDFIIVDKPCGDFQEENYDFIKHIYVDQSCGYCGDDYYGEVYIPLPNNKYLQFSYQC